MDAEHRRMYSKMGWALGIYIILNNVLGNNNEKKKKEKKTYRINHELCIH